MMRTGSGVLLMSAALMLPVQAAELGGELHWTGQVDLSVPISGRVEQVAVTAGAVVEKDALLVQLDRRIAQARVTEARAQLKDVEAQRAEARREWDRAKELFDRTVLSERELQLAENAWIAAEARYQSARAALTAAEVTLEYTRISAPHAARVLAVHVAPGEAVINNSMVTPLITLVARDRMRIVTRIEAAQAAQLVPDAEVEVDVAGRRFPARITRLGMEPLAADRPAHYALEAEFSLPADVSLRAGQSATLVLP